MEFNTTMMTQHYRRQCLVLYLAQHMKIFPFPADIAKICQSNLRKNFMYGGRRHLPFPVEIEALLVLRGREVGMLGRAGGQRLARRCHMQRYRGG